MRQLVAVLVVLLGAFVLGGCASVTEDKQVMALGNATNAYVKSMRWGYYENALAFLHPDEKKSEEVKKVKEGLRITGFDEVSPPAIVGDGEATQTIQWEYLYEDRQVVKSVSDRQTWSWDPDLNTWWLTSGVPDFK